MNVSLMILAVGGLLAGAVAASLVGARLRVPALLLFLGVGMAVGSDGAGWITFTDYALAQQIGLAALALILFDGGLNAGVAQIRAVLGTALRLAVVGTIAVALVTGVAAVALFQLSPLEGLLVGSILASTDSAAVFGLLRGSTLRRRLVHTMEAETAFNDPVVLVLVLGFIAWIQHPGYGLADMLVSAARELALGGVCGVLVATIAVAALKRVRLPMTGLYPVASFAVAALAYGAATSLRGSGLLAVYLAGLVLGDAAIPGRQTIAVFHVGVAWLGQVGLFITLGLLASPARLGGEVVGEGIALALVVLLIARPLATFATTSAREFTLPERVVLSWSELLGATPIVFATLAVAAGVSGSIGFFDTVVVAVVVSTLIQGLTFEPLARSLGLTAFAPLLPRPLVEFGGARRLGAELVQYPVTPSDGVVGRRLRDLELPLGITVVLIVRGDEAVSPAGSTRLKAGDTVHLLVREEVAERIPEVLNHLRVQMSEPTIAARAETDVLLGNVVTEPWTPAHGDPVDPDLLAGALVVERLRTRRDGHGALVRLEDGRYAVTGSEVAAGPAGAMRSFASRRVARASGGAEAAWWQEVAAALRR
jgi:cell volume regulation protein A